MCGDKDDNAGEIGGLCERAMQGKKGDAWRRGEEVCMKDEEGCVETKRDVWRTRRGDMCGDEEGCVEQWRSRRGGMCGDEERRDVCMETGRDVWRTRRDVRRRG